MVTSLSEVHTDQIRTLMFKALIWTATTRPFIWITVEHRKMISKMIWYMITAILSNETTYCYFCFHRLKYYYFFYLMELFENYSKLISRLNFLWPWISEMLNREGDDTNIVVLRAKCLNVIHMALKVKHGQLNPIAMDALQVHSFCFISIWNINYKSLHSGFEWINF